ncbi:MAG: methylglyoxal reductase (NADPH-dependent) gre2 [Bogoriella megaspora]|nr:MAG: methylglyoxal reductase (NADPH-dependent) gre2 [Bogoriella megaspora]
MKSKEDAALPPNGTFLYTDTRDLAYAHVQATLLLKAGGKRFLVTAGQISSQEIADVLRKNFPELSERVPEGEPGNHGSPRIHFLSMLPLSREILGVSTAAKKVTSLR